MKKFILLFAMLFAMSATAQKAKKMVKIEGMPEVQTEVEALVLTTNESSILVISKNKADLYEITQPINVTEGFEYHFFLVVQDCQQCDKKPARVTDYHLSVGQLHKNINKTRKSQKPKND